MVQPLLSVKLRAFVTIPPEQRLRSGDNERMLRPYTDAKVLEAITGLGRHKSTGPDGMNNDYYKDTAALMVPALVSISNLILAGSEVPSSFLESMIIPLRKKGDSDDAMNYRPISLLQTSYKVFAKVLATRLQVFTSSYQRLATRFCTRAKNVEISDDDDGLTNNSNGAGRRGRRTDQMYLSIGL